MISLSADISRLKPCDLETALDSIYLEFTPHPCKYNAIKEMATSILMLAIAQLLWMFIALFYFPRLSGLAPGKEIRMILAVITVIVSTFVNPSFVLLVFLFISFKN